MQFVGAITALSGLLASFNGSNACFGFLSCSRLCTVCSLVSVALLVVFSNWLGHHTTRALLRNTFELIVFVSPRRACAARVNGDFGKTTAVRDQWYAYTAASSRLSRRVLCLAYPSPAPTGAVQRCCKR